MAAKSKKATAHDAQILMQLYDLRREATMRKARDFVIGQFWPSTYEEFQSVMSSFGSEQNAYTRQVLTYWDMAAAMVLEGALHEGLFFKCNGELHFLFAKFGHFLPQTRKDSGNTEFLGNFEKLATKSPEAKARVKRIQAMLKARFGAAASAKAAG
jgi:hypothetical protein